MGHYSNQYDADSERQQAKEESKLRTIYKYAFNIQNEQTIHLPEGAEILSIQVQKTHVVDFRGNHPENKENVFIWALVNPKAVTEPRVFKTYGTGHPIQYSPDDQYLATIQLRGGELVFHIFEYLG